MRAKRRTPGRIQTQRSPRSQSFIVQISACSASSAFKSSPRTRRFNRPRRARRLNRLRALRHAPPEDACEAENAGTDSNAEIAEVAEFHCPNLRVLGELGV